MKKFLLVFALLVCCIIPVSAVFYPLDGTYDTGHMGYFEAANYTSNGGSNYVNNQSEINAWCAWTGHGTTATNEYLYEWFSDNSTHGGSTSGYITSPFVTDGTYPYYGVAYVCGGAYRWARVWYRSDMAANYTVNANFNGTPTSGLSPLTVSLLDSSTGNANAWNWSITPSTGWYVTSGNINSKNIGIAFVTIGNYTISHGVSGVGSDIETKTDYIQVQNNTATVTMGFRAKDAFTGNIVTGATIHLKDIENSSWTNGSTNRGVASITVLSGHHVNAYANATGYSDADYLNQLASPWTYDIPMIPSGYANVSAGNVTAYITVKDADTLQVVEGALVTARYQGPTQATATTNSAGVASFVVPNRSDVYFGASKSGYIAESIVLNTGTGSGGDAKVNGEIKLSRSLVTTAPTVTTLPGGGTPSPTQTYLAHCDPSASDYDATKCRQSHSNSSLNFLAENMDSLIMLCVMVTMLYLMGFRLGR